MFEITSTLSNVTDNRPIVIGEQALPVTVTATEITTENGIHTAFQAQFTERFITLTIAEPDGWTLVVNISRSDHAVTLSSHDEMAVAGSAC